MKSGVHSRLAIIHLNVALAMYFYVISEVSTRFLPAPACAEYQQEVPAGDSPLICTLSSTHSAKKPISIAEY